MLGYLLKRIAMTVIVLFVVTVFLSLLVHIVPGDPARTLLGPRASPELLDRVRVAMDLDKPIYTQVINFVKSVLHGDLGTDVISGRSINELVGNALPHTIILAFSSLGLAVLVGIPLGVYSASCPDSWLDRFSAAMSISFITVPSYVSGLCLLLIFSVHFKVMPAIGAGSLDAPDDYILHLILPTVALAVMWIGYLARLVRASLLEILNETYIRAAMAAGLPRFLILYKYALKNALIPTVAVLGVGIGKLMGGTVFVEMIFNRPGMGSLIYTAIQTRNFPMVRAGVLVVAFLFVFANLVADLVNTKLDPRIQLGRSGR